MFADLASLREVLSALEQLTEPLDWKFGTRSLTGLLADVNQLIQLETRPECYRFFVVDVMAPTLSSSLRSVNDERSSIAGRVISKVRSQNPLKGEISSVSSEGQCCKVRQQWDSNHSISKLAWHYH